MLLSLLVQTGIAGSSGQAFLQRPIAGHPVLEMRIGVDRLEVGHPFVCAEVSPLRWLSVEGCGTGAGFLHHDPDFPDMAHFRARARVYGVGEGRVTADLLFGAGFAEIQSTSDAPGFKFGAAREPEQIEGAGPEASVSVKGRLWLDNGGRTYATGDVNVGVAAIASAPTVIGTDGPIVPFAALTFGLGF
jgi:hypothetical protein